MHDPTPTPLTGPTAQPGRAPGEAPPSKQSGRGVTFRALSIGLIGVICTCLLAPYNDYTLANTPLIGNYLPIAVMLLLFIFVVVINAPLSRFRPQSAFSPTEIAVIFAMFLVGCSVPTTGLMRYFLPSLVVPQSVAESNPEFGQVLRSLHLPAWIFPDFASTDSAKWPRDPIVTGFTGRWTLSSGYPYLAFVRPLLTWGIFFGLLAAALLSIVRIAYTQWVQNERLPFPLAQIQLAILSPPPPGKWFNETLARRSFWVGLGVTVTLHIWNGLSIYTNGKVPVLPLNFRLGGLFADPPFNYAESALSSSQIYITAAAITFFLRMPISFSLWACFVIQQLVRMWLGSIGADPSIKGQADFSGGAFFGYIVMTLYVGRKHFMGVLRAGLFIPSKANHPDFAGAATAFRILLLAVMGMTLWLTLAGCTLIGAVVLTFLLLVLLFGITRVVAETGILHAQMFYPISRPFFLASALGKSVPNETFYLSRIFQCIGFDQRESLPVYASHALYSADALTANSRRKPLAAVTACMALALIVAYAVSAFSHLHNEYTYAGTLAAIAESPIDQWGARQNWEWQLAPGVTSYAQGQVPQLGSAPSYLAVGALAAVALYIARLLLPAWPLHPVGLVMLGSYSLGSLWASFFVGWLAKVVVTRLGGNQLYHDAKPFVIGLIMGEALAAAFWLAVAMILAGTGLPYHPIPILPR